MNLTDRPNRTWLCSVIFMDIVQYTKHPLSEQIALKNRFSEIVQEVAHRRFTGSDLFVVDAGDGAALCYLSDPEDMLFCATDLLRAFERVGVTYGLPLPVRIGINLGPVKIHTNVAGQPNPIGDGINVAQRVMSFANPGQILVSRSFYEVVGCLADEYARMFEFLGTREDKHVRKHEIYAVHDPDRTLMGQAAPPVPVDSWPAELTTLRTAPEVIVLNAPATIDGTRAPAHPRAAAAPPSPADPAVAEVSPLDAERIAARLAQYLGPIAHALTRRALKTADSAPAAIARLARRIPDERDRRVFLDGFAALSAHAPYPAPTDPALETRAWIRTQGAAKTDTGNWSASELETAARHLSEYVGPMAKVLVQRVAARAHNLTALYRGVAEHIPNATERAHFLQEAGVGTRPDSP